MTTTFHIGIGSNVGDRLSYLRDALRRLDGEICNVRRVSSVYETAPVGFTDQHWFLNAVVEATTDREPEEIHRLMKSTEKAVGRRPRHRWGPREIDLDLLAFGDRCIDSGELVVPHGELDNRRFVLTPFAEVAPEVVHPILGSTIRDLDRASSDGAEIRLAYPPESIWPPD